jgi:hypothetical protein
VFTVHKLATGTGTGMRIPFKYVAQRDAETTFRHILNWPPRICENQVTLYYMELLLFKNRKNKMADLLNLKIVGVP